MTVEITPAMVAAGVAALRNYNLGEGLPRLAERVFLTMAQQNPQLVLPAWVRAGTPQSVEIAYRLKFGGTGPTSPPLKTPKANRAEMEAAGFSFGDNGGLYCDINNERGPVSLDGFDLSGFFGEMRSMNIRGNAPVTLSNGVSKTAFGIGTSGGGNSFPKSTAELVLQNYELDGGSFYAAFGALTVRRCRLKNSAQTYGVGYEGSAVPTPVLLEECYITEGGMNAPDGAHLSLIQKNNAGRLTVRRCFVDVSSAAKATSKARWTGIFAAVYGSGYGAVFEDGIILGADVIEAAHPGRMPSSVAYSESAPPSFRNMVLTAGFAGYANNTSGKARAIDLGGNRNPANEDVVFGQASGA